jgi:putative transcriptional regulator
MYTPGPGMLLIAEPFLKDPNFTRTVILVCEHKEEGSFGFILNRKYDLTLEELIPDLDGLDHVVSVGGPVQRDTIHFLHQYPALIPGGTELKDGIFWGGDFNLATRLLREEKIDPARIRFFVGYSGWTDGQLEEEIKEKSWLVTPANRRLVFTNNPEDAWKQSLRDMGGEYEILVNSPLDPSLN